MNKIRQLHLIPIDLSAKLRRMQEAGDKLSDAMNYCLRKARIQVHEHLVSPLVPWQINTLRALPKELSATGSAAAALTWLGEGGVARDGTWMQISLVHFSAGLNNVQIIPADAFMDEQAQQLMSALQPLLSLSGFELHHSTSGRWYLWCEPVLEVQIPAMEQGFSTRNYDVLPTGRDAGPLRRLLTEIQMVLHQHPINQQREVQGLAPFNAVWLTGAGALSAASSSTLQRIVSDQAYVRGLCHHVNANCFPLPENVNELMQLRDQDMVVVMQVQDAEQFDTQWMQPLLDAINRGQVQSFDLYLDHAQLTLRGGRWNQLRRSLSMGNSVQERLSEVLI